jgi:hypothetical protein
MCDQNPNFRGQFDFRILQILKLTLRSLQLDSPELEIVEEPSHSVFFFKNSTLRLPLLPWRDSISQSIAPVSSAVGGDDTNRPRRQGLMFGFYQGTPLPRVVKFTLNATYIHMYIIPFFFPLFFYDQSSHHQHNTETSNHISLYVCRDDIV